MESIYLKNKNWCADIKHTKATKFSEAVGNYGFDFIYRYKSDAGEAQWQPKMCIWVEKKYM